MAEPKRATAFNTTTGLSAAGSASFLTNPTIASDDFKVTKDGGALTDLTTTPTVVPALSGVVQVDLSAVEMDADVVTVVAVDALGGEWTDVRLVLELGVVVIDDIDQALYNDSDVVVGGGGERTITVRELDGIAIKQQVEISANGLSRTRL